MNCSKFEVIERLNETSEHDITAICIPSYKRPEFLAAKSLLAGFSEDALAKTFIFVRESEYNKYVSINPDLQYVIIPEGCVSGVGSTRMFIINWGIQNHSPYLMEIDDDISKVHYSWVEHGKCCLSKDEDSRETTNLPQKIVQLAFKISKDVFTKYPDTVLGSLRRRRFANNPEFPSIKFQINSGMTPRAFKILNIEAISKFGLEMPPQFDKHGDDIGYAASILEKGFKCFLIQSLSWDHQDKRPSVLRNHSNPLETKYLHEMEYRELNKMDARHFLRTTATFPDGSYKFGDIDFVKYRKRYGVPSIIEYWDGTRKVVL